MNKALLHQIADRIEATPAQYDQTHFGDFEYVGGAICDTPRCVAGWACSLAGMKGHLVRVPDLEDEEGGLMYPSIAERAAVELGLTPKERRLLFCSSWPLHWLDHPPANPSRGGGRFTPTAAEAAAVLRRFAAGTLALTARPDEEAPR